MENSELLELSENRDENPANGTLRITERNRIPMTKGQQRLANYKIPGYHLHWMLGKPERIMEALAAGYVFVLNNEVNVVNKFIGDFAEKSGNNDLGTRVSQLAGGEIGSDGQPISHYLMKLPLDWHMNDMKDRDNLGKKFKESIGDTIPHRPGSNPADTNYQYIDKNRTFMS